jgi:hypothetical protein
MPLSLLSLNTLNTGTASFLKSGLRSVISLNKKFKNTLKRRKHDPNTKFPFTDPRALTGYNVSHTFAPQTSKQLLIYLLKALVFPRYHITFPFLVEGQADPNSYFVCPEVEDSVRAYEQKLALGQAVNVDEIPLVFVTVNKTGHSSLIFLSGNCDTWPERKVFSVGLLMGGTGLNESYKLASVVERTPALDNYLDSVSLNSPDFSNNVFGITSKGLEYDFQVKEVQIVTSGLLEKFNSIIKTSLVSKQTNEEGIPELIIYTGKLYSLISLQGKPDYGMNCASFISDLLPEMTAGVPAQPELLQNYCRPLSTQDIADIVYGILDNQTSEKEKLDNLLEKISLKGCEVFFRRGGKRRTQRGRQGQGQGQRQDKAKKSNKKIRKFHKKTKRNRNMCVKYFR